MFSSMSGKIGKRTVFIEKKLYSLWRSSWPYRMQFWKMVQIFFQEVQICQSGSSNFRKKIRKKIFWVCNLQFRQRSQKIFAKSREFFAQSLKKTKKIFTLSSLVPLKKFLWAARMQIWQRCRNIFYKSQKRFSSRSEFEKKAISFSKTCSSLKKRFFGHVECSLTHHRKFFAHRPLKTALSPKIMEKTLILKNFFFSKLSSGPNESSFDKRLFLLKVREWQNRSTNLKNFPWDVFLVTFYAI